MKKGLTEIVFILDRSGSMGGLEKDTIGGYNSMIAKQKTEEGEALISTILFDNVTIRFAHNASSYIVKAENGCPKCPFLC